MSQIFHHSTNVLSRLSIYGGVFIVALLGAALYGIELSPWYTDVNVSREQPVPFSHRHHAEELGIDCRYCHTSVEKSSFAGLPDTDTCMTCHSQLFTREPFLPPVRENHATGSPLRWNRVNKLPDFVFFNPSIHIAKGIGCAPCH